jgi:flagellar biosynthesis GTPase FlhF
MADKELILIDTHGVSQRDRMAVNNLISLIEKSSKKIAVYLALPCNQQEAILNEIIKTFDFKRVAGCILTKVDESIKITPALGIVMMHNLAIAYLCNGQDINNDIVLPTLKVLEEAMPIVFSNDHVAAEVKRKPAKWMRPFRSLGIRYFKQKYKMDIYS